MARLPIDDAAWTSAWRTRALGEKVYLALGMLAVCVLGPQPLTGLCVTVAAVGVAVVGARLSAPFLVRAARGPVLFVAVGLLGVALSVGSSPVPHALWSWGPLSFGPESLDRAAETGARSLGAISAVLLLAATTPMIDLLTGLRRWGVPAVLVEVAAVSYRMVFSLLDAQSAIRAGQTARLGYSTRRSAYRSLGMLAASTFIRAWTHAQRLEEGLAGRGYDGSLPTTSQGRTASVAFVTATTALLVLLALPALAGVVAS